jgi:glycosyltransferase involved in cell wall biosynthesis
MNPTGLLVSLATPPAGRTGWPWVEETSPATYLDSDASPGNWPKITIVCPSFQQGRFIEETIRSVLLQNYPNLEFIIEDGGSRDDTVSVLERYAPWLTFWESRPDRGQSHALNKACERATGEIIGWINSDDYYLPGAFAAVARVFRTAPHRLIFGDWCERQAEDEQLTTHRERSTLAFQVAVGGRHLPSHATFWPRSAHQPFKENLRFTMDADLFKRLAAAGLRPRHVAQPLAVFRRHPDAKTTTLIDIARTETEAWSRVQPWHTHWRWRFSRLIDRLQKHPWRRSRPN